MNHVTPPTAWTAEDARSRFDELARRARDEGPQRVTFEDGATVLVTQERPPTPPADEGTAEISAFLKAHWFEGLDELLERDYPPDREPDLGLRGAGSSTRTSFPRSYVPSALAVCRTGSTPNLDRAFTSAS